MSDDNLRKLYSVVKVAIREEIGTYFQADPGHSKIPVPKPLKRRSKRGSQGTKTFLLVGAPIFIFLSMTSSHTLVPGHLPKVLEREQVMAE